MQTHKTTATAQTILCAGTALLVMSGSTFAQINPEVKVGTADKTSQTTVADKGTHNPPGDKCGHNPPDDKIAHTADTRMLLPAVKPAMQTTKTLGAPQTDTVACAKAK